MQRYDSAVERISRDNSKGDSLDCTEGDSSVVTPDDRDPVVQPIKCDSSTGDSADFTFDEQGTSFYRGCLMVPRLTTTQMIHKYDMVQVGLAESLPRVIWLLNLIRYLSSGYVIWVGYVPIRTNRHAG